MNSTATKSKLNIGIAAPQFLPIVTDMSGYGGTERVIAELSRGLADMGHNVTLFAAEGSRINTNGGNTVNIVTTGKPLWSADYEFTNESIDRSVKQTLEIVYGYSKKLDILHFHIDESLEDSRFNGIATVNTLHGDAASMSIKAKCAKSNNRPLIFISESQRQMIPWANSAGVVYNGINVRKMDFSYEPGNYLVFLGRVSLEKGMHIAIDVAMASNTKLIAMYREPVRNDKDSVANADWEYYHKEIKPRLEFYNGRIDSLIDPKVEIRDKTLKNALALVGPSGAPPSTWTEPFGLFVSESMASGTPAIVYNRGGPAEIVTSGETGYIATSLTEKEVIAEMSSAVEAIKKAGRGMRINSRQRVQDKFSSESMAQGYEEAYLKLLKRTFAPAMVFMGFVNMHLLFNEGTSTLLNATSQSNFKDMLSQQFMSAMNMVNILPSQDLPIFIGTMACLSVFIYRDLLAKTMTSVNRFA